MDSEIQFGEVERTPTPKRVRPDQNGHLALATVHAPTSQDLPVFVDLDVMRELLAHAHSDTRVELGGVLLGGQFEDDAGRPFVQITDCLRARHYESTKGSFKFTHDTWEQITREREQLPADAHMVGWYHTHPGWGVFLSGLDLFICDHFFNKPLDVALVIDPCQRDSGFFQWTEGTEERIRRTGGFSLYASRFRTEELREVAAELEGQVMPESSRSNQAPITVQFPASPASWQTLAVIGMLTLQFCLVVLLALRSPQSTATHSAASDSRWAELQASLDRLERARQTEADIDAKLEVLEMVVRQDGQAPAGILKTLADRGDEIDQLRGSLRAEQSHAKQLDGRIGQLESQLAESRRSEESQRAEVAELQDQLTVWKGKAESAADQTKKETKISESAKSNSPSTWWIPDQWSFAGGILIGAFAAATALMAFLKREPQDSNTSAEQA
jgi:proteasome lid subunit RPN8/RPN11